MRRLYISGPMTGLPGLNFEAFNAAARALRDRGFEVVNPAELNPGGGSWADCLRVDLRELLTCAGVAVLDGWQNSRGANLEVHVATRLSMRVAPVDQWMRWGWL